MAINWDKSLDELKDYVKGLGYVGEWSDDGMGKDSFRTKAGEVLNFWASKGSVNFQGKNQDAFGARFELSVPPTVVGIPQISDVAPPPSNDQPKIFIVYGHDDDVLKELEWFLMRIGIDNFRVMKNEAGNSQTIIEALEKEIKSVASFGIVLLTQDDWGYPMSASEGEKKPRARQNVILEMGMFFGALGRERTAILRKGNVEIPSDTDGIIRHDFNNSIIDIGAALASQMKAAGFVIDEAKLTSAIARKS